MRKIFVVDIGEFGWSLYMVAHLRWLKQQGPIELYVMTYLDRQFLYRGIADCIMIVPPSFYEKFNIKKQDCFGLHGISDTDLREYFDKKRPADFQWLPGFQFRCCWPMIKDKMLFEPFKPRELNIKSNHIVIFPRYRSNDFHAKRNLSNSFYDNLAEALCDAFPDHTIAAFGKKPGAYEIFVKRSNFTNYVWDHVNSQHLIDLCSVSVAAVGGTSAPPKISLLQGVPTFIIGHERQRFTVDENWMNTKVGFHDLEDYTNFNEHKCIQEIINFFKEVIIE